MIGGNAAQVIAAVQVPTGAGENHPMDVFSEVFAATTAAPYFAPGTLPIGQAFRAAVDNLDWSI